MYYKIIPINFLILLASLASSDKNIDRKMLWSTPYSHYVPLTSSNGGAPAFRPASPGGRDP